MKEKPVIFKHSPLVLRPITVLFNANRTFTPFAKMKKLARAGISVHLRNYCGSDIRKALHATEHHEDASHDGSAVCCCA